jgi:CRISPR/Cas system CSM-associated protein Csm5 (group 7 of RAMP superfamily)
MKQLGHLTSYQVTLEVQAPLFIGSGEKLSKKEYLYLPKENPKENKILMLDLHKMVNFFLPRKVFCKNTKPFCWIKTAETSQHFSITTM